MRIDPLEEMLNGGLAAFSIDICGHILNVADKKLWFG
jgi:hypothetical protein